MSKPRTLLPAPNLGTQADMLLDHLVRQGSISPYEAASLYRVHSFHRRMSDLRALGVKFQKKRTYDNTGRPYVRYFFGGFTRQPLAA